MFFSQNTAHSTFRALSFLPFLGTAHPALFLIPHPSSFILVLSSFIPHPSSLILVLSSLLFYSGKIPVQTNYSQRPGSFEPRPPEENSDHGKEIRQERPFKTPLPPVVRQSRQSQYDGAVPGALHELRPEARGAAGRQTHHRHRPIRLGPFSL